MPTLRLVVTAILLAAAMVICGVLGRRQRVGIVLLAMLSAVWLTVDRDWEGGVIVVISPSHGFTTADIVGVTGLAWAAWLWWRTRRS